MNYFSLVRFLRILDYSIQSIQSPVSYLFWFCCFKTLIVRDGQEPDTPIKNQRELRKQPDNLTIAPHNTTEIGILS